MQGLFTKAIIPMLPGRTYWEMREKKSENSWK